MAGVAGPSEPPLYLAGVRNFHLISGYNSPTENTPRLQLALRGCKRLKPPQPSTRLPITPDILRRTKACLSSEFDDVMIWAAMCVGFFSFLWAGEFTTSGHFDPSRNLSCKDISIDSHVDPSVIRIKLNHSKTDQFGVGAFIFLSRTGLDLCPVSAFLNYLTVRPSTPGPLFVFSNGSCLSKTKLTQALNRVLTTAGIDPTFSKGHSFRIGAATTAASQGLEDSLIKKLGCWTSNAFTLYIRIPDQELSQVSLVLARS